MGDKIGKNGKKRQASRLVGRWANWHRKPAEGAKIGQKMVNGIIGGANLKMALKLVKMTKR